MKESQDINDKKSVKVNCTFCGKEIDCPEHMLKKSKKHMCYDCFQNAGELVNDEDLGQIHVDIPMDKIDEFIPNLTDYLVEEVFPEVWKEKKEELKVMSKKDLAREMFGEGSYLAILQMLAYMKKMDEDEGNSDKQN